MNKNKNIKKYAGMIRPFVLFLILSLNNIYGATHIDDKIKIVNEKIKSRELDSHQNDQEMQALVDEYNELIRQKEQHHTQIEHISPQIQSVEDAILQRMQALEQNLDLMRKRLEFIESKLGITSVDNPIVPPAPQAPDHVTISSIATSLPTAAIPAQAGEFAIKTTAQNPQDINAPAKPTADNVDTQATLAADSAPTKALGGISSASAQYNQAMKFLTSEHKADAEKAVEAFESVITEFPDDAYGHQSYVHAGEASLKLENYDKAESYFAVAITKPLNDSMAVTARLVYAKSLAAQTKNDAACTQLGYLKKQPMTSLQTNEFQQLQKKYCARHK